MAWKESHKQVSRERILTAAAKLFTHKGFDQVGIDDVMQTAGMTRGAFYAHFSSKTELYEQAIINAGLAAAAHFNEGKLSLDELINRYLSQAHLRSNDIRCPLPCLVSDMAHEDERVKHTYTKILKGFTQHLDAITEGKSNADTVLLQAVLLIGGMAVARSITDEKLSKKILSVCSEAAKNAAAN